MPVAIYVQPYDPIEKYVVVDDSSRASTSVKANLEMSSHDYADQPLSTDEHQIMFTSSSSPPSGSKQSVRLLRGR
jgi:hypothetical protein